MGKRLTVVDHGNWIAMKISVRGFESGSEIPIKFTCDGPDVSPEVYWEGLPEGTRSIAIIMDDPDAPSGLFTHWIAYNIPAGESGLHENFPKVGKTESGIIQGKNDFGRAGYGGPCPPRGKPHRYFFRIYALNSVGPAEPDLGRKQIDAALEGKIIGEAHYLGTYKRG